MREELDKGRIETSRILQGQGIGLVAIVGPCANHIERRIINEGRQLAAAATDSLVTIHRIPPFKPRTPVHGKPKPWAGLESTNPTAALSRMLWERRRGVHVAHEVATREHVIKYRDVSTFVWLGARSLDSTALNSSLQMPDMLTTPLGIKNGLCGSLEPALKRIEHVQKLRRQRIDMPAASVLVFRGGTSLQTPKAWEDQYKRALELTGGNMIVDIAHGSEMAHDPNGLFRKTTLGQMACLDHVLTLAQNGITPRGIMIEASDFEHPNPVRRTDPNMSFTHALQGIKDLHSIIMGGA